MKCCSCCCKQYPHNESVWTCSNCLGQLVEKSSEKRLKIENTKIKLKKQLESIESFKLGNVIHQWTSLKHEKKLLAQLNSLKSVIADTIQKQQEKKIKIKQLKLRNSRNLNEFLKIQRQWRRNAVTQLEELYQHLKLRYHDYVQSSTPLAVKQTEICLEWHKLICRNYDRMPWRARVVFVGMWASKMCSVLFSAAPYQFTGGPAGFSGVWPGSAVVSLVAGRIDPAFTALETRAYLVLCSVLLSILFTVGGSVVLTSVGALVDVDELSKAIANCLTRQLETPELEITKVLETATPTQSPVDSEPASRSMYGSALSAGPASPLLSSSTASYDDTELKNLKQSISAWLSTTRPRSQHLVVCPLALLCEIWNDNTDRSTLAARIDVFFGSKFRFASTAASIAAEKGRGMVFSDRVSLLESEDTREQSPRSGESNPIDIASSGGTWWRFGQRSRSTSGVNPRIRSDILESSNSSSDVLAVGSSSWKPRRLSDFSHSVGSQSASSNPFMISTRPSSSSPPSLNAESLFSIFGDASDASADHYAESATSFAPTLSQSPSTGSSWKQRLSNASPIYNRLRSYGSNVSSYLQFSKPSLDSVESIKPDIDIEEDWDILDD